MAYANSAIYVFIKIVRNVELAILEFLTRLTFVPSRPRKQSRMKAFFSRTESIKIQN